MPSFGRRSQFFRSLAVASLLTAYSAVASADPAAQWVTGVTVTSVADVDYNGELVQVFIAQAVVSGCTYSDAYDIQDPYILKGSLALLTTALVAGRQVTMWVTGACDSAGRPLISNVRLQ
jgi:hypothetical protein